MLSAEAVACTALAVRACTLLSRLRLGAAHHALPAAERQRTHACAAEYAAHSGTHSGMASPERMGPAGRLWQGGAAGGAWGGGGALGPWAGAGGQQPYKYHGSPKPTNNVVGGDGGMVRGHERHFHEGWSNAGADFSRMDLR